MAGTDSSSSASGDTADVRVGEAEAKTGDVGDVGLARRKADAASCSAEKEISSFLPPDGTRVAGYLVDCTGTASCPRSRSIDCADGFLGVFLFLGWKYIPAV